jgi:hypothetical protein
MYNNASVMSAGGFLAMTGLTGNPIWAFLAAFALIALGLAVLRTIPRREA